MSRPDSESGRSQEQQLNAVLAEYMKRRDAGQTVDRQMLLRAYPDLADRLQSYFQAEALIDQPALAATKLVRPSAVSSATRVTNQPLRNCDRFCQRFSTR